MLIIISKIIRMIISIIRLLVIGEAILFQRLKIPPYVVVLYQDVSTTFSGQKSRFGVVAVFKVDNEVGIDGCVSVGYKCEIGDCIQTMQSPRNII